LANQAFKSVVAPRRPIEGFYWYLGLVGAIDAARRGAPGSIFFRRSPRRPSIFREGRTMAGKKQVVEIIALACTECKRRNYTTTKNRKTKQEKLELMKYCKWDHKHTLHKETKVK